MYGHYFRISSERLKELQSQPEALEEFLYFVQTQGRLQDYKDQYFGLNYLFSDLHIFLGQLPLPDSLWRDVRSRYSSSEIGTKIKNVSVGVGPVRLLTPSKVQEIANALKDASQEDFLNCYRENYPTRQDSYDLALFIYTSWKQFLQEAARVGQAVLSWIT
jgi:hypothetical protein